MLQNAPDLHISDRREQIPRHCDDYMSVQVEPLEFLQHHFLAGRWCCEDEGLREFNHFAHIRSDVQVRGTLNLTAGPQLTDIHNIVGMLTVDWMRIYRHLFSVTLEISREG